MNNNCYTNNIDKLNIYNLSFELPPTKNNPPFIDKYINHYLQYILKKKKLDIDRKMYKDYNNN